MARDYNKDYDNPEMTWDKYHKTLNDEGMSDDQIKQELTGTKWDTQGKEYGKWRDGIPVFVQDTPEATKKYIDANPTSAMVPNEQPKVEAPVEQPTADDIMKETRKQYANDNEGYKKALADKGIETGDSRSKVRSIQQAYYDGLIDKGTRDYMMADAIAKFARNTGRDIGNIGAQYTGGTINNNYEEADWNKRNDELFKQQTSSEAADVKGSDKEMERSQQQANLTGQKLGNTKANMGLEFGRFCENEALKAEKKGDNRTALAFRYLASVGSASPTKEQLALAQLLMNGEDPKIEELEDAGKYEEAIKKSAAKELGPNFEEQTLADMKDEYPGLEESQYKEALQLYYKLYSEFRENGMDKERASPKAGYKADAYLDDIFKEKKRAAKEAAKKAKASQEAKEQAALDEAMINAAM